jgi:hypothetical protein
VKNGDDAGGLRFMDVWEAMERAECILPGHAAPEGETDPRWQAIIVVEEFIRSDPEPIWPFIVRWGSSLDEDLRTAVATCLLEDLLKFHFECFFPRLEEAVQSNALLADTFSRCWKLGQAEGEGNVGRFEALQAKCRRIKS